MGKVSNFEGVTKMSTGDKFDYIDYLPEDIPRHSAIDRKQMEIDKLQGILIINEVTQQQEEAMRDNHPTVRDAWEKYQIALKLVSK